MKRTFLMLIALFGMVFGASAMNLKEAYKALSNIPNVTVSNPDYNLPMDVSAIADYGFVIKDGNLATAYHLDAEQIRTTGNAAYTILNQVPMVQMINGANNGLVAALVYAEQTGDNSNDLLIVSMSGYYGSVAVIYSENVPDATCTALQNAQVDMDGNFLSLKVKLSGNDEFNIILNKGR